MHLNVENNSSFIYLFRKLLKKGKEDHDETFWVFNLENIGLQPQKINSSPYLLGDGTTEQEEKIATNTIHFNSRFDNLAHNITHTVPLQSVDTNKLFFFLRKRTQKLCQNKVICRAQL